MAVVAAAWWSGLLVVIQRSGLWAELGWAGLGWAGLLGWARPRYKLLLDTAECCMLTLHQDIYSTVSKRYNEIYSEFLCRI